MNDKALQAALADGAGLAEGTRFETYLVGPCIGSGGMARVYRALHERLQRPVALKVLTEGVASDGESRERFLREGRIAATVKHPNVVNIFDVGVHQGTPYLVMELLEGQDLAGLLEHRGALDAATLIEILVPIVAGLAAVHDAGVVHRDLKPGNIFLARAASGGGGEKLEPKLLDFGISKAVGADQLRLTFAKTQLLGTPFYISPEAVFGREVTSLSDQYSLGVLMYECATAVNPFEKPLETQTVAEILKCIAEGLYVPPLERNSALSPELAKIIQRAMQLDPADRFPNLRQLGRELLQLADSRLRITWGPSFGLELESAAGDARAAAESGSSLAPLAARSEKPGRPPLGRRRALGLALIAGALLALLWLRVSEWRAGRADAALAIQGAHAIGHARQREPSLAPVTRGDVAAADSEPPAVEVARALTPPALAPKLTSSRVSTPKSASARGAATEPRSAPSAVRASTTAAATEPATDADELPVGTNGAPILD